MVSVEDWQPINEPLLWARTELPTMSASDQKWLAEGTLRDLFARDLIFVFRTNPTGSASTARNDPTRRLSSTEVDAILSAVHGPEALPLKPANVFFAATTEGTREASNAPAHIIEFWQARAW